MNNEKKPIIIATAALYENIIWFEQLLDFLSEISDVELWLPLLQVEDGTVIEINALYPLLEQQFPTENYIIPVTVNINVYEDQMISFHTHATEKINGFLQKNQSMITLDHLQEDIQVLLASQYDAFLPSEIQETYKMFRDTFCEKVYEVVQERAEKQKVILVPIEYYRSLVQKNEQDFYTLEEFILKKEAGEEESDED